MTSTKPMIAQNSQRSKGLFNTPNKMRLIMECKMICSKFRVDLFIREFFVGVGFDYSDFNWIGCLQYMAWIIVVEPRGGCIYVGFIRWLFVNGLDCGVGDALVFDDVVHEFPGEAACSLAMFGGKSELAVDSIEVHRLASHVESV